MQLIYEDIFLKSFMTFHSQQTILAQNGRASLTSEKNCSPFSQFNYVHNLAHFWWQLPGVGRGGGGDNPTSFERTCLRTMTRCCPDARQGILSFLSATQIDAVRKWFLI